MNMKDKLKICFGKRRFPTSRWVDEFLGHVMESGRIVQEYSDPYDVRVVLFKRTYDISLDKADIANSMSSCYMVLREEERHGRVTECVWADMLPSRKVSFCFWEWLHKTSKDRFMSSEEYYEASIIRHLSTPGDMGSSENI